jgi:hypothetical protein
VSYISCAVGSPAVLFVEGKLSVRDFKRCETSASPAMLSGSSTVVNLPGVPVSKVCYFRHCLCFDEIGPAFQLNTGNLGLMF